MEFGDLMLLLPGLLILLLLEKCWYLVDLQLTLAWHSGVR